MWNNVLSEIYEEQAETLWGAIGLLNIVIAFMGYVTFPVERFNIFASIVVLILLTISKTIPVVRFVFYPLTMTWIVWSLVADPMNLFFYLTSDIIFLHWGIPACIAVGFAASEVDNRVFYGAILGSFILERMKKNE